MASEFTEKKKLLYSDLFKGHQSMASSASTESVFGSNVYSSSSGLSSSFGSELGSPETSGSEDEDFFPELTRQMAELMLQEDEDNSFSNCVSDELKLKNQATVRKQGRVACGRRVRGSESTQRKQLYKTKQQGNCGNGHYYGSGMRAVFLDGSGSSNGYCGTGVFLPRGSSVPAGHKTVKKKSGECLTVLMPTRVLDALEFHFNRSTTSKDSINHYSLQNSNDLHGNGSSRINKEVQSTEGLSTANNNENEEMQLPQEWTY